MTEQNTKPNFQAEPKPKWVLSVRDLSSPTSLLTYEITTEDGQTKQVALKGRKRQVTQPPEIRPLRC
ncbi:MAG: hypothetical protein AAFP85_11000 [Pseudomonadota bacterium]